MFQIEISAEFVTYDQAIQALRDAEEVIGKCDGEVIDTFVSDEDEV